MILKYYIDSQVCKGIMVGSDLYIESKLQHLPRDDKFDQDTLRVRLTLSKVSEEDMN